MKVKPCWPLVITILMWGGNFVGMKIIYRQISPEALYGMRFMVMLLGLRAYCHFTGRSLKIERGDFWPVMYTGFISMGVYLVVFTVGMHQSSPAEGALIMALVPLLALAGELLRGDQVFQWRMLIGGVIAVGGVAFVVLGKSGAKAEGHLIGDLIVFSSAAIWAYASITMRPLLKKYSAVQLLAMSFPGALPLFFLSLPWVFTTNFHKLDLASWLAFAHIAIGSGIVGFTLFYEGVRRIGSAKATTYQYFTPVTTAVLSLIFLATPITIPQLIGIGIVVLGLTISKERQAATAEPDGEEPPGSLLPASESC